MEKSVSLICSKDNSSKAIDFLGSKSDYLHFDIMDGSMTDCLGLPVEYLDLLYNKYLSKIEVHIMSTNPEKYIYECIKRHCACIVFHIESCVNFDIKKMIDIIKNANIKVGVAVSPSTAIDTLIPYLRYVDLVNILTVNPGRAGQPFQKKELNKVVLLKQIQIRNKYSFKLEVDGSCNEINYPEICKSGADIVVVGNSGLFSLDKDIHVAWEKMQKYMITTLTVYLHADLVGNTLKENLKEWLINNRYHVVDLYKAGVEEYPECARELCKFISNSNYNFGILCCGTGLGMSMVANRVPGIRAAVVSDVYSSKMAREHNDANVLCLGSRVITKERSHLIVETFLKTQFLYGKHTPRVDRFDIG